MINDSSYKLSFIFALTLHLVLLVFLFVKLTTTSSKIAASSAYTFINATTINASDFNRQPDKILANKPKVQKQEKPAVVTSKSQLTPQPLLLKKSPIKKEQLSKVFQKNLLMEHAKELAELKKERQKYTKRMMQQQLQQVLEKEILAEQQQLAGEQAQAYGNHLRGEVDKYKSLIIQAIASHWIVPEGVDQGASCKLLVNLAPGGVVLNVQLIRSSGNLALDRSAQVAVLKASPLPVPEEGELFNYVRTINLTVRPEGVVGN